LVRVPACHAGGRGFEPRHSRHFSFLLQYLVSGMAALRRAPLRRLAPCQVMLFGWAAFPWLRHPALAAGEGCGKQFLLRCILLRCVATGLPLAVAQGAGGAPQCLLATPARLEAPAVHACSHCRCQSFSRDTAFATFRLVRLLTRRSPLLECVGRLRDPRVPRSGRIFKKKLIIYCKPH
jgi:hypothetical protein